MFPCSVATRICNDFYYRPTVAEAFASVQYLMTDVNFGWLIRSIHRWSASMMVLMMILHVCRVYWVVSNVRELTWVSGVVMAVCTVSFGVTGYSLPWDQIGYWAVKIVTGVPDAIGYWWLNYYVVITWWSINFNTFLQSTYFCWQLCVYVNALLND
jgi:cytochrome b6